MDAEIKKGDLNDKYDVFILPDDSTATITGDRTAAAAGGRRRRRRRTRRERRRRSTAAASAPRASRPCATSSQKGGTLVTLGGATDFAIERLGVAVRNVVADRAAEGVLLPRLDARVTSFDNRESAGLRHAGRWLGRVPRRQPAFDVTPTDHNEQYEIVVRYADRDVLESGWLVGEENLAKHAAMIAAHIGQGTGGADRFPRAAPRADPRHLQAAVQRAGERTGTRREILELTARDGQIGRGNGVGSIFDSAAPGKYSRPHFPPFPLRHFTAVTTLWNAGGSELSLTSRKPANSSMR